MHLRSVGLVVVTISALGLLTTACTTSSSRRRPPPRNGYYQPQPGQPQPTPGQPGYRAPGQAAPAPMPWAGFRLPPPLEAFAIFRPVNVQALTANMHRSPCRPAEMSPGNWIGFDCSPPTFISRAMAFQRPQQFTSSTANLPASVDHRQGNLEGPIKNQGAVGTCTAVSLSTAMEHALRRSGHTQNVSAIHIWSQYGVPQMGRAGDSNIDKRLSNDQTWPYDPAQACKMMRRSYDSCGSAYNVTPNTAESDPQIQAKKKAADSAGRFKLIGVEKLAQHDPNEIAGIIAGGDDLWVAFNVNTSKWRTSNMVNNVIQDYNTTESTGHAVVLSGFRTVNGKKQFLIHNSWGKSWGENGYAWIGENMVGNQLRYAYRVRVGDPNNPGGSNPTPGGGGACPNGQAMDLVYGQCAAACPGGGRPAAGLCMPGMPGSQPPSQPKPGGQGKCPAGQAPDVMSGQCVNACPGGAPPIGGLCLPHIQ